jgi:ATP-dependent DNA ligase
MEARTADMLPPQDGGWVYEPKWDGFRCLAFKEAGGVELLGKSGKPLGRYFPEIVALLRALPVERFGVDGELVVEVDGHLSFDALQMRLHPAESRIHKLSVETPARLILFDMLVTPDGTSMLREPLTRRRQALESFVKVAGGPGEFALSPTARDLKQAERWLTESGHGATDGVVAKRLDGIYQPGERGFIKSEAAAHRRLRGGRV